MPQSSSTSEAEIRCDTFKIYANIPSDMVADQPDCAVGSRLLQGKKNGIGEYTSFVEDAAPNVSDNHAIDEGHIPRGVDLDLEVQMLVRARRVTSIRAFRVVEVVATALERE